MKTNLFTALLKWLAPELPTPIDSKPIGNLESLEVLTADEFLKKYAEQDRRAS